MGRDGTVKELVPAGRDGLGSAQGMEVDAARRILWVCSTAHKQARGIAAAEVGRAALHAFHADSGKPLGRYPLAGGEAGHSCDSLTLDGQGAVYVGTPSPAPSSGCRGAARRWSPSCRPAPCCRPRARPSRRTARRCSSPTTPAA